MGKDFWNAIGAGLAKVGLAEAEEPGPEQAESPGHRSPGNVAPPPRAAAAAPSRAASPVPPPPDAGRIAELDKAARERLIAAMQNDGAPLVEELADALDTLAEAIPDEKARYLAALKLQVKQGHPVTAILSDFDRCLGCLDENHRTFEADTKIQLDRRVGTKVQAVAQYEQQIRVKGEQIEALRLEIAELAAKRQEDQAGILIEQQKITQVQDRFGLIYQAIRADIEAERAKIAQYGKGL